ncbi:hypothetical protein Tco_0961121 [Tanacetum coccineum]
MSGVSASGSCCLAEGETVAVMDEGCGGGVERLRKTNKCATQWAAATVETMGFATVKMSKTLRVMRYMGREMSDMQAELLAHREQQRRARQPGPDARIPDHQDASRDADSHI